MAIGDVELAAEQRVPESRDRRQVTDDPPAMHAAFAIGALAVGAAGYHPPQDLLDLPVVFDQCVDGARLRSKVSQALGRGLEAMRQGAFMRQYYPGLRVGQPQGGEEAEPLAALLAELKAMLVDVERRPFFALKNTLPNPVTERLGGLP